MNASPQFHQLDIWKPARELVHETKPGDYDPNRHANEHDMWEDKRLNNQDTGLDKAVAKEGVKEPVMIFHGNTHTTLEDGHHRAIAAYDHSPDTLVQVQHEWKGTNPVLDMFREVHPA
jgi:hypothetical protein